MLNVPLWLLQPDVWPTIVNVPEPEPMPVAIVPCMVRVLVDAVPGAVQDIVIVVLPPFIIPGPIWPVITVPAPKHCAKLFMVLKFMPLAFSIVLFCVMLKVNDPNGWAEGLERVSDHAPVAGFEEVCEVVLLLPPPQATSPIASTSAENKTKYFIKLFLTLGWNAVKDPVPGKNLEKPKYLSNCLLKVSKTENLLKNTMMLFPETYLVPSVQQSAKQRRPLRVAA